MVGAMKGPVPGAWKLEFVVRSSPFSTGFPTSRQRPIGYTRLDMGLIHRWLFVALLLWPFATRLAAATGSAEQRAFAAGKEALRAEFYPQAERFFQEFIQQYPASTNVPEAILLQAQAQIEQTNYAGALELLAAHQKDAGSLADQYLFWLAEARFRRGEFSSAADSFASLVKQFPISNRRLEAVIREATARAQISYWRRVVDLLQ